MEAGRSAFNTLAGKHVGRPPRWFDFRHFNFKCGLGLELGLIKKVDIIRLDGA